MKIIVDAFGGDNAPSEIIKGCQQAVEEYDVDIILTGNRELIEKSAEENSVSLDRMSIEGAKVNLSSTRFIYSGEENTVTVNSVTLGGKKLTEEQGNADGTVFQSLLSEIEEVFG